VFFGLLLGVSSYADTKEKVYMCVGDSGVQYLISINPPKFIIWYGTESERSADLIDQEDRYLVEFDDRKIIYFKRTNIIAETWKESGNQSFDKCRQIN
jgi:hypothetical protein|tara:strand:- start:342 stop:635 length:294 start_codon:yes stop_codon:yes gene_type:complete